MGAEIDHGERAHSKWGASGAHRFFACPGSLNLSDGIPNESSIYAAEGTAAHELSEKCFAQGKDAADFVGEMLVVGNHAFECTEEFAEHVQAYIDVVRDETNAQAGDILSVEEKFDLSQVHPGAFGTADAVIWQPRRERLLVIDLKFGKGHAVEAKGSVQLRYYALGALLKGNYPAKEVELVIVQPRAPHPDGPVRREVIDVLELLEFKSVLADAISATLDSDAPRNAGSWCGFCPAAGICPERREKAVSEAKAEFAGAPSDLDDDTLAGILLEARQIEDWIKAVRKEAYMRLAGGAEVPGFKLVAKRATRRWVADETVVATTISDVLGVDEDKLWTRKMLSPAQVEKVIPKGLKAALKEFIVSVSSGLTVAVTADKRAAVIPNGDAMAEFADAPDIDD